MLSEKDNDAAWNQELVDFRLKPLDVWSDLNKFGMAAGFLLPKPYGSAVAGVVNVVEMIFGPVTAPNFNDLVKAVVDDLAIWMTNQEITKEASVIHDAAYWCQENVSGLANIGGQDPADIVATISPLQGQLEISLNEDSPLRVALENLLEAANDLAVDPAGDGNTIAGAWQVLREKMYMLLAEGVGVYLTQMRLRVQWQAALDTQGPTETATTGQGSPVYFYFDQFRQELQRWVNDLNQLRETCYQSRASFVNHYDSQTTDPNYPYETVSFYDVVDGFFNLEFKGSESSNEPSNLNPLCIYLAYMQHFFQPTFDNDYASQQAMTDGFGGALTEWMRNMLPPKLNSDACADSDLTTWGADAPMGVWVAGAKVKYAVATVNASGDLSMGDWGTETTITTRACAHVTAIPVDGIGIATVRQIWRHIVGPEGGNGTVKMVRALYDNVTTSFVDSDWDPAEQEPTREVKRGEAFFD